MSHTILFCHQDVVQHEGRYSSFGTQPLFMPVFDNESANVVSFA